MAIGDYVRTNYVNDTTPSINATNLNNIEAKVLELDDEAEINRCIGSIKLYAGSSVPSGYLLCDGRAVSRSTYSSLYTAIGTTWGVGDGSTTFNVPDMREAVPVGIGTYSAVTGTTHGSITAHDSYTLGQFKDDQLQGLAVTVNWDSHYGTNNDSIFVGVSENNRGSGSTDVTGTFTIKSDGTNGTPRTGTTTRGKSIGLNYIIRY